MRLPGDPRLRADLSRVLEDAGEPSADRVLDALLVQMHLLARWNPRYHLTALRCWEEILERHVKESLLPLRWIAPVGRLLDVGTGNGFPAIPILCCRRGLGAVLVERSDRKALFLDAVVREIGLANITIQAQDLRPRRELGPMVRQARAAAHPEPARPSGEPSGDDDSLFDYVISRATLPPERYLPLSRSWVRPSGRIFMYAGSRVLPTGQADSFDLVLVAREPIPDREDSFLWVFEPSGREAPAG